MKILAKKFTNKVLIFINAADFAKCSAAQTLLNPCAKTFLRAKRRFLRFALKCQSSVTESALFWLFSSFILLLKRLGMSPLEFIQYCDDFEIDDSDYCLK